MLALFVLVETNRPTLTPQSQLAFFAMLGLVVCFLNVPLHPKLATRRGLRLLDLLLALGSVVVCAFVILQTEPRFESLWIGGQSLGDRAAQETSVDIALGLIGLLLVLEATRRAIGWALPALALVFLLYAFIGPWLPDWLFPHRGYSLSRVVSQTFLHSQGVFSTALKVMFSYVYLFVLFGAFLEQTGATRFIIDFAQRLFGGTLGGPAKVAVLSSGLMGSLSGSAVANTATTGTFTIPMMRSAGFKPETAAGVEAAASSGGALVPPVMGAGAYMMLEIVTPPVTIVEIIRAALIPAALYYVSLLLIVDLTARRIGARGKPPETKRSFFEWEAAVFLAGMVGLIGLLLSGYTVFRSVTLAIGFVLLVGWVRPSTRVTPRKALEASETAARGAVPLITAAASVGIIIGVVTLTGVGTKLPSTILRLAEGSLLPALFLIMVSTIILGMGLPSAVVYLLMATLIGPVLGQLGVVPLAAHLFIFYFGMMSMVTPPVALAAYTAGSIAGAGIMQTGFAAFRFALVGFTLPYMFVFRPQLLMLDETGGPAGWLAVAGAVLGALVGIVPLAAGIAGHLFGPLSPALRALSLIAAALLLLPGFGPSIGGFAVVRGVGLVLVAVVATASRRAANPITAGS